MHSFHSSREESKRRNERLYRTGDIARWLPSGDIEFLYRKDTQVKIRGNRVELSEIEHAIKQCPAVKGACVLLISQEFSDYLVAYVILSDLEVNETDL